MGLVARTAADVRDVIVQGESGILAVSPPSERPEYFPSLRKLKWPNGNEALCFTSEEPSTLRGPQFHYAFADEFAAWRQIPDEVGMTAWANLRIAARLGPNPQIFVATTPKRVQSLKDLLEEAKGNPKIIIRKGSTMDNASNLAETYIEGITGVYAGTKLGRQELYGEMLDDIEGALFSTGNIDQFRANTIPVGTPLKIVGVDPTVAEKPGDECGIVVMAATADRDLYKRQAWVLEDASIHGSPEVWARRVVDTARKWGAPVVAEKNQGGALIRNAIQAIDPRIPVHEVWSKQGKALRAEPVALIYEQGRIHHLGYFAELEDQMTTWEPEMAKRTKSPDRLDALVLAATALMVLPPKGFHGGVLTASVPKGKIPSARPAGGRGAGGGGRRAAVYGAGLKKTR
jgi:phage terminase large subunit-like protein